MLSFIVLSAVAALVACGGGNPASPSSAQGVVLRGTVTGDASAHSAAAGSQAEVVSVYVQENPAIKTTVGADGSFTLRGLPEGSFTLVFTNSAGKILGTLTFSAVAPNQEITITVQVSSTSVTLIEEQRNGIGNGGIEIEGIVSAVLALDPAGESRFLINGKTVLARPGQTAIREGNRRREVTDVTVGRRVHVKGTWLAPDSRGQSVLAQEIMLQGSDDGGGGDDPPQSACFSNGANAQVEGRITSKGSGSLVVNQQGKGDFTILVSSSTRIRKGNTNYTFAQLQPGWRVHVSGTGMGSRSGECQVQADEIKVQQT
jgi:hypothetical protein